MKKANFLCKLPSWSYRSDQFVRQAWLTCKIKRKITPVAPQLHTALTLTWKTCFYFTKKIMYRCFYLSPKSHNFSYHKWRKRPVLTTGTTDTTDTTDITATIATTATTDATATIHILHPLQVLQLLQVLQVLQPRSQGHQGKVPGNEVAGTSSGVTANRRH